MRKTKLPMQELKLKSTGGLTCMREEGGRNCGILR